MNRIVARLTLLITFLLTTALGAATTQPAAPTTQEMLSIIDFRLQLFREAADEADINPAARQKVTAILDKQRAMAEQFLPKTHGPNAIAMPADVVLAAESNAQREMMADPDLKPVTDRMGVNEILRLLVKYSPRLFYLLLEESGMSENDRVAANALAAQAAAKLQALPAEPRDTAQVTERDTRLRAIHRQFRQALFARLPAGSDQRFIQSLQSDDWQRNLESLMILEANPALRAGIRPPDDALISMYTLHNTWAPADGEYQLMAAGSDQPFRTEQLKKEDALGFAGVRHFFRIDAMAGEKTIELPRDDRLYYWRKAP